MSRGHIVGRAGASLTDASWAANENVARIGQVGEQLTAAALDRMAHANGPSVLHDLRIPIPGFTANIDHAVVTGRTVTLIDSKVWKPGLYWTFGGHTRRGREKFAFADKKTLPVARKAVAAMLKKSGVEATLDTPLLVVHPSNARSRLNLALYRPTGARAISGRRFTDRYLWRRFGAEPGDPHLLVALAGLTARKATAPTPPRRRITEHPGFDL
ncbi:nuclease-related domain-containing protein [Agromyces subbeticus]|uniref:nuclease-related domain-containing protein n=1 Tax=Agromyces subbeticus TaxID=293890 RepID=UPI0003B41378|nr:nuclease-related domain-containing protein [Agromyces subbeticus]